MNTQAERIRALNDELRTTGHGGDIVITQGIHALPPAVILAVIAAVQSSAPSPRPMTRIRNTISGCSRSAISG